MPRGLGLLPYGTEGIGKTSFALQFPKPLRCLSINEPGYVDLEDVGEVPDGCSNIEIETLPQLKKELSHKTDAATIVVDSLSGLQELIFEELIETKFGGSADDFFSYYKGPRQHAPIVAGELCQLFENLRNVGKHILLLAHDCTDLVKNPRGLDYTTIELAADIGIRDVFKKWAQCILFMTLDPSVARVTKEQRKVAIEGKMEDEDMRVMFTQKSLVHSAKNKLHLPILIPLGGSAQEAYKNFTSKLPPNFKEMLTKTS